MDASSGCGRRVDTWPEVGLRVVPAITTAPPPDAPFKLQSVCTPQRTRIVMMKNLNVIAGRHKDSFSLCSRHVSLHTGQRLPLQRRVPTRGQNTLKLKTMLWAGSWGGGVMARRCARGFLRLSQGKLGTAIRKKNVFLRLPEIAPHSSSAAASTTCPEARLSFCFPDSKSAERRRGPRVYCEQ